MRVPSFMLKKLYVSGSLTKDDGVVSFKLNNTLANATLVEPPVIHIDGEKLDPANVTAIMGDEELTHSDVGPDNPIAMKKGAEVEMRIEGLDLEPGAHKISIKSQSKEWDTIEFEVEDKL